MTFKQLVSTYFIEPSQAYVIPFIFSLTVLVFLWGLTRYIWSAGSEEAREEGLRLIKYGVLGMFVMISVWGLVKLLSTTLGFDAFVPQIK